MYHAQDLKKLTPSPLWNIGPNGIPTDVPRYVPRHRGQEHLRENSLGG